VTYWMAGVLPEDLFGETAENQNLGSKRQLVCKVPILSRVMCGDYI
jgi:hypothetical protein